MKLNVSVNFKRFLAMMAFMGVAACGAMAVPVYAEGEDADDIALRGKNYCHFYDDDGGDIDNPNTDYRITNIGHRTNTSNYFHVPKGKSSSSDPITITLDGVNVNQDDEDSDKSYITIDSNNYVIIKLKGDNYIQAGVDEQFLGSDDGMAGIHVSKGATVKVTSSSGDGSTEGFLEVHGGGGKYGGAAIGTRYNDDTGNIIIAGGTIWAYGGHSAAGIGSGRDGKATDILITGGNIYAKGGEYGAGIGAGDWVGAGEGGDLVDLTITGGTIEAVGGYKAAGIGCSEGGSLEGDITISNATIKATGGYYGAGIGGGSGGKFEGGSYVDIYSGNIEATGGEHAAGIGGGGGDLSNISVTKDSRVSIKQTSGEDLYIKATGGESAAGIGAGMEDARVVNIDLDGGTIKAYGGKYGAGIGAGRKVDKIDITGTGRIEAYGGKKAAGIGGGENSTVTDHLTIIGDTDGSSVTRGKASSDKGRGLKIKAIASYGTEPGTGDSYDNEGAAIGGAKSECADITIKNAILETRADEQGADIGGGGFHLTANPPGEVDKIVIDNCEITSSSLRKVAPGIGAGYGGKVNTIKITNTTYKGSGIGGALIDRNYTNINSVDSITIDNSDIHAEWDEENPGHFESQITPFAGPLDHGAAGIGSGQFGSINNITITNSNIVAHGYGSGAGIGGGGAGGQNYSVLSLNKYTIGDVGEISISNCHVEAISGCARFKDMPSTTISDGYQDFEIKPIDFGGGAGIGSGSASNIGTIDIHDCDYVKAIGYKGSGIGSGCATGVFKSGNVDHIYLENIDSVEARGGKYCPGIGAGGGNGFNGVNGDSLIEIYINNCKNVSAYGDWGGAGIGLGYTTRYKRGMKKGERNITIKDSKVYAKGGKVAAGIGGGGEDGKLRYGGDSPEILICGKSRVEAYGGENDPFDDSVARRGGGAGIGGGYLGGASYVEIRLEEDEGTPEGTLAHPEYSSYYVHAVGCDGGAGIGSGGNEWVEAGLLDNSSDSEMVLIKSGAVFAAGGNSIEEAIGKYGIDTYMGAGAGIGGGSKASKIRYIKIEGGYIEARAGYNTNDNDKADDIGSGGDFSDDGDYNKSDGLYIADGTVMADDFGDFNDFAIVEGGSVRGIVPHAVKSDYKTPVYRTTATLADNSRTKVKVDPKEPYNSEHIFTDSKKKVYLYLEERGSESDHEQCADITVNNDKRTYTGYTNDEHTGILKMEGEEVPFIDPGIVRLDEMFDLKLDDATGWDGAEWTLSVSGAASEVRAAKQTVSPGVSIPLHADAVGSYVVEGESAFTHNSEVYWGSKALFKGKVLKPLPEIEIVGDSWKSYDAQPAVGPHVTTNSTGNITYQWYTEAGEPLDSAPVDAGTYKVSAKVAESPEYDAGESEIVSYSIHKSPTHLVQYASQDGAEAHISVELQGLFDTSHLKEGAKTRVNIYDESGSVVGDFYDKLIPFEIIDGRIIANIDCAQVPAGIYTVVATYVIDNHNYEQPNRTEEVYNKDLADRYITADGVSLTYGDNPYTLTVNNSSPGAADVYSYSIYYDSAEELASRIGHDVEPTISITPANDGYGNNTAIINVNHAGKARVRINLVDEMGSYGNSSKFIDVEVKPADLTISSFAYLADDDEEKPVDRVTYGKIDTLDFGLEYSGLKNNDTESDFTHGYGTLEVVPMFLHQGASDTPCQIGIRRIPVDAVVDGHATKLFYSRDYNVILDTEKYAVTVDKAMLAVQPLDTGVTYGEDAPEFGWDMASNQSDVCCDGLASWDVLDEAVTKDPVVALDTTVTGGKDFPNIDAGNYPNALTMSGGEADNYMFYYMKGNLNIDPANINDKRRFDIAVDDTVYDGTEQKQTVEITDNIFDSPYSLEKDKDFEAVYDGDSFVYAGKVNVTITGKGNYQGERVETYDIAPRKLTVNTESAEKIYDGRPLTADGTMTGVADTDGRKVSLDVTGSQTEVGKSDNTYSIVFDSDELESSYVVGEEKLGTLYVAPNDVAECYVSNPEDVVYNGNEQKQPVSVTNLLREELVEGTDYELKYSDDLCNAGTVTVTVTGLGAYTGSTFKTYDIKPAPLTIDTEEKTKKYDGKPLTAGGEMYGLVNNETATLKTTGSITDAGSVPNTYVIVWDGTADESNYFVSEEDIGTLNILPSSDGQNGIKTEGYIGTYDGEDHPLKATALLDGSKLYYSLDGGKTWSEEAPVFRDASDEPINVMIKAENPDYVKGSASVGVQITIRRAALSVTTDSASKQYDGKPLTASGELEGLINGETAELVMTGSQTEVGKSMNTYEIKWNGTAKESNYQVDEKLGTLTVLSSDGKNPQNDPSGKSGGRSKNTGDSSKPILILIIGVVALAGAGCIIWFKKRKK